MAERQNLTKREIVLSVIAGALLLVLALVGYSSSFKNTTASVLIAQDDSGNQQRNLKDQLNNVKNLRREIQDIARDTKKQADTANAEA
ncbi:MAG: hypothetical protein AAB588_04715, partial [Patescibacteria group bacterium]